MHKGEYISTQIMSPETKVSLTQTFQNMIPNTNLSNIIKLDNGQFGVPTQQ